MNARALLLGVALAAAAALTAACNVHDYCINCATGDGGDDGGGGGIDAATNDGIPPADACIQTGAEVCNGLDDDCNGTIDDNPAQVGDTCGANVGQCTEGVYQCVDGELGCTGVAATPEQCDGIDNNCNGSVDEGNPEGGQLCGSDVGECSAGVTTCVQDGPGAAHVDCVGAVGTPGANPEICDGKDNDCNGLFDDGIATAGPCGYPNVGQCVPGVLTCTGGSFVCVGGTGPSIELCDNIDQDCDGNDHNGFDLTSDVANCGVCGHSCVGTIANATEKCQNSACAIASCDPGFFDDPTHAGPDCDYACNYQGPTEVCNNVDDNCNGQIDENLPPPPSCVQIGACAGATATCTPTGYECNYGPNVSVDAAGNIQPETTCDGIDNDCDGVVDDSFPQLGTTCADSALGICQSTGHVACDPADATHTTTTCVIDTVGGTSSPETCDGLDNNCNGTIDDNPGTLQSWVALANGHSIMKYEASRPDARAGVQGQMSGWTCSRAGVQPWTMVTHDQAETACAAVGARLCSEEEWHMACSVVAPTTYPIDEPAAGNHDLFFEAEDFFASAVETSGAVARSWVQDYTHDTSATPLVYSGISDLRASPNTGANVSLANAPTQSPRLDFLVNFRTTGNHYVWVRMLRPTTSDDTVHVGIDPATTITTLARAANVVTVNTAAAHGLAVGNVIQIVGAADQGFNGTFTVVTVPSTTRFTFAQNGAAASSTGGYVFTGAPTVSVSNGSTQVWQWRVSGAISVPAAGNRMVSVYMGRDGVKVDAIVVTTVNNVTPTTTHTDGGDWSFATNPDTFVATTCNGDENDTDLVTAGDQDDILNTGSKASCYANQPAGGVLDLSGNVKEWTAERRPAENPMRGGASNNIAGGTMCNNAFTLADDAFYFTNVGFRCCK